MAAPALSRLLLHARRPAAVQKGTRNGSQDPDGTQRRLTEAMLSLGHSIDKQGTGPKRLQMLRDQASLSDKRELLRSTRM